MPNRDTGPRLNENIRVPEVRLVDEKGEMQAAPVPVDIALQRAKALGLDLVEVAPDARPPVCKLLNYGKLRFDERKKKALMKKKQKSLETKELQFRLKIEQHDYQVKMRHAERFLTQGHRVRVVLRFKGREMSHQEIGVQLLERIIQGLSVFSKPEGTPKTEGRRMLVVLVPTGKKPDSGAPKQDENLPETKAPETARIDV